MNVFINPITIASLLGAIVVAWAMWQAGGSTIRHEYRCPKCHIGIVKAERYGSFDQFEQGKCEKCGYTYDCLTEDVI